MELSKLRPPNREELQWMMELPHGRVKDLLVQYGYWDHSKDPDYDLYYVEAEGMITRDIGGTADIEADSLEEAEGIADALCARDFDWAEGHYTDVIDFEVTTIRHMDGADYEVDASADMETVVQGWITVYATDLVAARTAASDMNSEEFEWELEIDDSFRDVEDIDIVSVELYDSKIH